MEKMDRGIVKRVYGTGAKRYEDVMLKYWEFDRQKLVDSLGLKGGEKVLEVGVGTGKNLPYYPNDVEVVGIDFTPGMLELAREKLNSLSNMDIKLLEMDAENMTFSDNEFGAVLESFVLCVAPNPTKIMKEIIRVSKRGAKFAIFDYCKSKNPEMVKWQELIAYHSRNIGFPIDVIVWDPLRDYEEIIEKEGLSFRIDKIEIYESENPFLLCCTMLLINIK